MHVRHYQIGRMVSDMFLVLQLDYTFCEHVSTAYFDFVTYDLINTGGLECKS